MLIEKKVRIMCKNVLILLSGGLDSSTLFTYVEKEMDLNPIAIFFDRGQGALTEELQAAEWVCRGKPSQPYNVSIEEWRRGFGSVPMGCIGRNAIMVLLSVPYALAHSCSQIAIGSNISDAGTPDSSKPFIEAVNSLLKITTPDVEVVAPFIEREMTKKDIAAWARKHLGMDFINRTHSCFRPIDGKPCNSCSACGSRYEAIDSLSTS